MIFDETERIIRYVELDAAGEPFHECLSARIGGADEEKRWSALTEESAYHGQSIVRFCNHEARCRNPTPAEIESDGRGGIKAKAEFPNALDRVELWDEATMRRQFVQARDESYEEQEVFRVVRMEPGEWTQKQLDDGLFFVTREGKFDWRSHASIEAAARKEPDPDELPPEPAYRPPAEEGGTYR